MHGPYPLGIGTVPNHVETRSYTHVTNNHTEFSRSASNDMGVGRGTLVSTYPKEIRPSSRAALPNSIVLGQMVQANYGDPPEKFDPSRPAFQGHSRSLETIRIDRLPMTSC